MKDYKLKIQFGLKFTALQKTVNKIKNSNTINAIYDYPSTTIKLNLASLDFKDTEPEIMKRFTEIMTHELLHYTINDITDKTANDKEEAIVEVMAKQREWGDF